MNQNKFIERIEAERVTSIMLGQTLDHSNAEAMVEAILRARELGHSFIILNCEKLKFISSAGVGAILGTIETFRDCGGDILLCNVSEAIDHVLRVLDLRDFLTVRATIQDAVAACKKT